MEKLACRKRLSQAGVHAQFGASRRGGDRALNASGDQNEGTYAVAGRGERGARCVTLRGDLDYDRGEAGGVR